MQLRIVLRRLWVRLPHSPAPAPTTACFKGGAAQCATAAHARGVSAKEVTEAEPAESGQAEGTTTTTAAPESALVMAGANGGKPHPLRLQRARGAGVA